jgi:hypothetical protein
MPAGPPQGMGGQPMYMDPDMIGAIKIKDGLFIGDELASTVKTFFLISIGSRICCS